MSRPDILAFNIYGDVKYTWTIFMVNNMLDPFWSWPMDTKNFGMYLTNKYGTVDKSKIALHHYEQIIHGRTEVTGKSDPIPERVVELDYTTYRAVGEDDRQIVYAYEWEQEKNEVNRTINLIDASFISGVLDEARQTFR